MNFSDKRQDINLDTQLKYGTELEDKASFLTQGYGGKFHEAITNQHRGQIPVSTLEKAHGLGSIIV